VSSAVHRSGPEGEGVCTPGSCPCEDGACTLSKYVRTTSEASGSDQHALTRTEQAVADQLSGMPIDMESMAAVHNIYRAANTIRKRFESSVLAPHDLTWTGWVVLWVVWIWGDIETRHVATEAGISKGTLTGVVGTLERRGLLTRRTHPADARRVLVSLTPKGRRLMVVLFPRLNVEESFVTATLSSVEKATLARALRKVALQVEPS
jgi:MarR family transcriptional regulator, organic hydroperoxide resistance regulator